MKEINVRKATIWDAEKLTDYWLTVYPEYDKEKFYLSLLLRIKSPDCIVLVFEKKEKMAAFIVGDLLVEKYTDNVMGSCECMYILKEYRSLKLNQYIIDVIYKAFEIMGATKVTFNTKYDTGLSRVYERKGFEPYIIAYKKEV